MYGGVTRGLERPMSLGEKPKNVIPSRISSTRNTCDIRLKATHQIWIFTIEKKLCIKNENSWVQDPSKNKEILEKNNRKLQYLIIQYLKVDLLVLIYSLLFLVI